MTLIVAISVLLGDYPDIHHRMRVAARKKIELVDEKQYPMLSRECFRAMRKLVRKK